VGESWIYDINYTISQSEINAGADLVNHVSVTTAEVPGPVEDNATTSISPAALIGNISVEKTGTFMDENNDGYADVGETISYEFNITNIGNVTLYDVNLTDDNAVITDTTIASLVPGGSDTTTFTGVHTVTWQDIIDGKVVNQAIVTAKDPQGNDVNDTSDDPQNPVNVDPNNDGEPDDATSTGLPIQLPSSTDDGGAGTTGEDIIIDIVNNDNGGTFALDATTVTLTPPAGVTGIVTVDGDVIGFVIPGEGTWSVDESTGEVTFSPEDGYVGDPTPIEYTIEDEQGNETTSEISINYPPVANDDHVTADRDEVINLDVLANDQNTTDPLDPTTVRLIGPDGNETEILYVLNEGTWTVEMNGSVTFEPDFDFSGDATMSYIVRETNGDVSNEATITIRYPGFPIATDNLDIPITEYHPTVIDVLANGDDWGSNGPGTVIITFTEPLYGTVYLDDNGTPDDPTDDVLIYTPAPDVNNVTDSFTYTITDALGFTSTATVTLDVNCASSQSSDSGDALNVVTMFMLAIMTAMTGLYFVRKEEERGEAS
jgi:CshA-type fibril repeat protein